MIITGAAGFLGSTLARACEQAGWKVLRGVRRIPGTMAPPPAGTFACDLPNRVDVGAFRDADICIHTAWTMRPTSPQAARETNEHGTAIILQLCREHRVRLVFLSSMSAHPAALGYYGKSKLAAEATLDPSADMILRPGLIVGPGGIFERMAASVRTSFAVPLFDGGTQPVQTVHVDDLCRCILAAVALRTTGRLTVGEKDSHSMRWLLEQMAAAQGVTPRFVGVPSGLTLKGLRAVETLGIRLPVSADNLLGLLSMRHQEPDDMERLFGIRLRTAAESVRAVLGHGG